MQTELATRPQARGRGNWHDDVPVAAAAAGAAALLWCLARLAGVHLAVHSGGGTQTVGLVSVIVTPIVATLAAGALLRWWQRRSPRARSRWTAVSAAILVASLTGPASAVGVGAGLVLAAMHLAVGSVIIGRLGWRGR